MYNIQNDSLKVGIDEKGAELKSIVLRISNLEYMWSGDPAYWAKTSPVLFPIVGTLKGNRYFFNDKPYNLSRHGFARDKTFSVTEHSEDAITFSIQSDESTLA